MRTRNRLTSAATVVVTTLLLASCGLYAKHQTQAGDGAPGVSDDSIKIGLFAPLSGDAAVYGKGQHSIEAVYREVNENGGINGRELELVIEDSECDPTTVSLLVKKLIERDEVFLIHGGMCSNAVGAAMPEITASGIPYLVQAATTTEATDPPTRNAFSPWVTQPSNTRAMAQFIADRFKATGESTIGVLSQRDDWGTGWMTHFEADMEEAADEAGIDYEIVADEEIQPEISDATAAVRLMRNADPDIAVIFAYPQPMSVFLRDAEAQGLDLPMYTANNVQLEEQVAFVGRRSAVEQLTNVYCFREPLDSPEIDVYKQALAKYYPNDKFDANALLGVAGAEIVVEALDRAGDDLTWDSFIDSMESITDFESPLVPEPAEFGPFEEGNPSPRVGSETCRLSALDPKQSEGDELVVFEPTLEAWRSAGGTE